MVGIVPPAGPDPVACHRLTDSSRQHPIYLTAVPLPPATKVETLKFY